MDTVSMGMVSTDKYLNTLLCVCNIVISQIMCVCAEWYLQTNTVAFISALLSGPLSHEQTYRTQIPRRWKNPLLLGQEVQRLQWWGHHFTPGLGWEFETDLTTELKDTGTPFRCKLCMWEEKASFGGLRAITWTAVMENKHKPFVFHLRKTIFALWHTPHSETRTRALLTHIGRTAAVSVEQRTVSLALRSTSPWQHFFLRRRCSWTRFTHKLMCLKPLKWPIFRTYVA